MVETLSEDKTAAARTVARMKERAVIDFLMAQRVLLDLSQKDIAARMGCTQSRVSKLERSRDSDLCGGDLDAYAEAVGLEATILFSKKDSSIVDRVKYHVLSARNLMLRIAEISAGDATMEDGAKEFFAEVLLNSAAAVLDAVKPLDSARKRGMLKSLPREPRAAVLMEEDGEAPSAIPTASGKPPKERGQKPAVC